MGQHALVADAIYTKVVEELRGRLFTAGELAILTGVSERQVQRWASGTSKPEGDSRARLLELRYIIDLLRDTFTDEGIEIWLHGRNRRLGGEKPIDLLEGTRFDEVLQEIERLNEGVDG